MEEPTTFALFNTLRDVIVIADRSGTVVYTNAMAEQTLGWEPGELAGQPLTTIIPERLRATHLDAYANVMRGGPPKLLGGAPVAVPALHRSGREVEFELSLATHSPGPDETWVIATLRETATRRRLERAQSLTRYLALSAEVARRVALTKDVHTVEEAGEVILRTIGQMLGWDAAVLWIVDEEGTSVPIGGWSCADLDHAMADLAGQHLSFRSGEGLPGRVVANLTPAWIEDVTLDDDFPRGTVASHHGVTTAFAFPIHGAGRVQAVIELLNREHRPVDTALLGIVGQIGGSVGQFLQRKRAADEVAGHRARKAAMLDSALDAVVSIDHRGIILEWSPAATDTFGWTAEEARGRSLADTIIPLRFREAHAAGMAAHLTTGQTNILGRTVELVAIRKDGVEIPVDVGITRLPDVEPAEFIGFLRDISERKASQRALAESRDQMRKVAEILQESLLPTELPTVPGLQVGAAYRPAGDGTLIGGDFYDMLHVRDRRWAAFIGDVCGKGAEAARVTALARYALRTTAMQDLDPLEAVRHCNDAILGHEPSRFCSVVHLTIDVDAVSTVNVVRAGHTPPLILRADGRLEALEGTGTILGVLADPPLELLTTRLEPGDTLVLYTDGVTEASVGDGMLGLEGFTQMLRATSELDARDMASRVCDRVVELQDGHTRDDIAVLVLKQPS